MTSNFSYFARPLRTALLPLVAALVLAGCASTGEVSTGITTPVQFKEQTAKGASTLTANAAPVQPAGNWWVAFNDPMLNELVERAAVNNTSVQQAAARLGEQRGLDDREHRRDAAHLRHPVGAQRPWAVRCRSASAPVRAGKQVSTAT